MELHNLVKLRNLVENEINEVFPNFIHLNFQSKIPPEQRLPAIQEMIDQLGEDAFNDLVETHRQEVESLQELKDALIEETKKHG